MLWIGDLISQRSEDFGSPLVLNLTCQTISTKGNVVMLVFLLLDARLGPPQVCTLTGGISCDHYISKYKFQNTNWIMPLLYIKCFTSSPKLYWCDKTLVQDTSFHLLYEITPFLTGFPSHGIICILGFGICCFLSLGCPTFSTLPGKLLFVLQIQLKYNLPPL